MYVISNLIKNRDFSVKFWSKRVLFWLKMMFENWYDLEMDCIG